MNHVDQRDISADERFRTIGRGEESFLPYLDGSFSRECRALPVRSLNVGTDLEQITFEIVSLESVRRPMPLLVLWQLLRPQAWVLSMGPMAAVVAYCLQRGVGFSIPIAAIAFVGVVLFQSAVNLFNDFGDHLNGRDRIRLRGGSRVIQKGWLAARTVRQLAWGLSGLALLCGVPAVARLAQVGLGDRRSFLAALVLTLGAALVGLEFAFQKLRLKYRGWAEVLAFALTGPVLTAAYSLVISTHVFWGELVLGAVFGCISLTYFHSANFENIMADSQAGIRTWATRAGFDASQKFFVFTSTLIVLALLVYASVFERSHLFVVLVMVATAGVWNMAGRVLSLKSPLSSQLMGLRRSVLIVAWILSFLVVLTIVVAQRGHTW